MEQNIRGTEISSHIYEFSVKGVKIVQEKQ